MKEKKTKLYKWFRFMRGVYFGFASLVYPIKKHGHTQRFDDRSYIIVGNHKSVLDVVPLAICTHEPVYFMAKKELAEKKIGRWFTKKCECILVSRDGNDARAIMQAMKYLKEGKILGIFPEGTRNKTDELFLPFKSGAAALAIKTRTPVILMVQTKKMKAFRKSHVYYSEPFEFTEFYDKKLTPDDVARADEILLEKMTAAYRELEKILNSKKKKK